MPTIYSGERKRKYSGCATDIVSSWLYLIRVHDYMIEFSNGIPAAFFIVTLGDNYDLSKKH